MTITISNEKKQKMEDLVKGLKSLDGAMLPFQEQRKDIKKNYVENGWLSKDEVKLVSQAYNALKRKVDMDDISAVMDAIKGQMT